MAARLEPGGGQFHGFPCDAENGAVAEWRFEREAGHRIAKLLALLRRPILDEIVSRVEARLMVKQAGPERGQGAQDAVGPASAPRISKKRLRRTSGNSVVRWSAQSVSVGFSPGS